MRFHVITYISYIGLCLSVIGCSHDMPVKPQYDAKKMAEDWYANGKMVQDNDEEVSHYSYPVYQADQDNPDIYTPVKPRVAPQEQYPADNDADYYYYPLYFSE